MDLLARRGRAYSRASMKGYGQFCPIAMACETFAERWTPLILRELLAGSRRFNEIRQGLPLISRTLLGQRLRELEAAGVVQSRPLARGRGRVPARLPLASPTARRTPRRYRPGQCPCANAWDRVLK